MRPQAGLPARTAPEAPAVDVRAVTLAIHTWARSAQGKVCRLVYKRDRSYALAQLIQGADRSVRKEHQPILVHRGGEHQATVTDSRRGRSLLAEASDRMGKEAPFRAWRTDGEEPVAVVAALSPAACEQPHRAGERQVFVVATSSDAADPPAKLVTSVVSLDPPP